MDTDEHGSKLIITHTYAIHLARRILQARFDTEDMAAEAAVAMGDSECDASALRLQRQQSRFKTWFAAMWKVYRQANVSGCVCNACVLRAPYIEAPCPADLEHAIVNYPTVARSFEELDCHGVIFIYLAMKQGPARDAFFAEWQSCETSMGLNGRHGPPGSDRWLAKLFDMLATTASKMEAVDMQIWSDNTNRGVGHHSGWLPFLQRLNVIGKAKAPRRARRARQANGSKTVKTGNARVKAGVAKRGKQGRGVTHVACCLMRACLCGQLFD